MIESVVKLSNWLDVMMSIAADVIAATCEALNNAKPADAIVEIGVDPIKEMP